MGKRDLDYLKSQLPSRDVSFKSKSPAERAKALINFCRLAVEVKHAHPEDRAAIAYQIASMGGTGEKGSSAYPEIQEILNLSYSLELPDPHIDMGDGTTPAQGWEELEKLVEQAHNQM